MSFKLWLMLLGLLGSLYLMACIWLYARQTRLLFFPSAEIQTLPADYGMDYQEVWIPVADSSDRLHGWWIPAEGPDLGTVLYLHGNGINIGANVEQASRFHQLGLSVLLIDYRGYGQSGGSFPNEQRVYQDAEAAWNYLQRQIPPEQIFIFGHSLGGAVAIDLAVRHPDAAGLIVQSSFTSVREMVDRTAVYRIFPIDWLLTQRFDSITKVPNLKMPVLFIHGEADLDVPSDMSEAMYRAAPNPKDLYLVPPAGHNNVATVAGEDYLRVVREFVDARLSLTP